MSFVVLCGRILGAAPIARRLRARRPTSLLLAIACALGSLAGGVGPRTALAVFGDSEAVPATLATAASFSATTYYLHNNPSPPVGNTNAQANLAMNATAPSAATLFNYDANHDAAPGRLVLRGGGGASESTLTHYQNWRGPTAPLFGQSINGTITVEFWSGVANFTPGVPGEVTVFLRNHDTLLGLSSEISSTTVSAADWQAGSTAWVKRTVTFNVSVVLLVGHQLEVKLIVPASSGADMWLAYDTTLYRSRVRLP